MGVAMMQSNICRTPSVQQRMALPRPSVRAAAEHTARSERSQRSDAVGGGGEANKERTSLGASRRAALLAAAAIALAPPPAQASALGDFWRSRQTQNGGAKILAPIRVSRGRLQGALDGLGQSPGVVEYREALGIVRPASFNCYIYEVPDTDSFEAKASILQQKYGGAVEVCTFKLILKNVVLNIKDKQSDLPAMATAACEEFVGLFSLLDMKLDRAAQMDDVQESEIRQAFQETIDAADAFDLAIQKCLGVA